MVAAVAAVTCTELLEDHGGWHPAPHPHPPSYRMPSVSSLSITTFCCMLLLDLLYSFWKLLLSLLFKDYMSVCPSVCEPVCRGPQRLEEGSDALD